MAKVAILGAGGWGLALSLAAHRSGNQVFVWSPFDAEINELKEQRESRRLLPGVKIPDDIKNFILNPVDVKDKSEEQICTFFAGLYAINTFAPDFITCKNYDEEKEFERQILKCISNDQSDSYNGDVICVGYGAGDNDILTVVLCKSGNEVIFTQLFEESLL